MSSDSGPVIASTIADCAELVNERPQVENNSTKSRLLKVICAGLVFAVDRGAYRQRRSAPTIAFLTWRLLIVYLYWNWNAEGKMSSGSQTNESDALLEEEGDVG